PLWSLAGLGHSSVRRAMDRQNTTPTYQNGGFTRARFFKHRLGGALASLPSVSDCPHEVSCKASPANLSSSLAYPVSNPELLRLAMTYNPCRRPRQLGLPRRCPKPRRPLVSLVGPVRSRSGNNRSKGVERR